MNLIKVLPPFYKKSFLNYRVSANRTKGFDIIRQPSVPQPIKETGHDAPTLFWLSRDQYRLALVIDEFSCYKGKLKSCRVQRSTAACLFLWLRLCTNDVNILRMNVLKTKLFVKFFDFQQRSNSAEIFVFLKTTKVLLKSKNYLTI